MPRTLFILLLLIVCSRALARESEQWSNTDTADTPQGGVHFHGPFARENVDVTCDALGKHDFIRVSFDLLIIHTWDGNWALGPDGLPQELGPDSFRLGIKSGPTLLYTTFSNVPYVRDSQFQNFPSPVPGDAMPAQSGAKETDTHGYLFPDFTSTIKQDSTYHIDFLVPHHDPRAVVQMQGINLQNLLNECWGVSDFHVTPLAANQVPVQSLASIQAEFEEALRADSMKRMDAFANLICGMDATVAWLQVNVAAAPIDAAHARQLVKSLSLPDSAGEQREAAMQELLTLGPQAEVFLRDERNVTTAEGRCRIDKLLQRVLVTPIDSDDLRRVMLATRVLEVIGTPAAMDLRKKLVSK
jgi:hypothetical protein